MSTVPTGLPLPATYSGDPLNSPTDEVRFLCGDTGDVAQFYLSDAEINYCLVFTYGPPPNVIPSIGNFLPAMYAADGIVAKLKLLVDESVGDLRVSYSKAQAQFTLVSRRLRSKAAITAVPTYFGGLSLAAKIGQYSQCDLLGTATRIDGMDNTDTTNSGLIPGDANGSDAGT